MGRDSPAAWLLYLAIGVKGATPPGLRLSPLRGRRGKRGKDAGSLNSSAIQATEDTASRRPAAPECPGRDSNPQAPNGAAPFKGAAFASFATRAG